MNFYCGGKRVNTSIPRGYVRSNMLVLGLGAFVIACRDPRLVASIPCSLIACLPSEARCNCLTHPGKDVNAQRRTPWLWGQYVLTRRHAVSLPRCVEHCFSEPNLTDQEAEALLDHLHLVADVVGDAFIEKRGPTGKNTECEPLVELGNEMLASAIHAA